MKCCTVGNESVSFANGVLQTLNVQIAGLLRRAKTFPFVNLLQHFIEFKVLDTKASYKDLPSSGIKGR